MTFLRRGPWKARSPWKGRGPWCAKGPFGVNDIPWTLDATAAAIREAIGNADAWGTTGATTGWRLPGHGGVRLSADAMTGPRLEQQQDGTYRWAAHNLLLRSEELGDINWASGTPITVSSDAVVAPNGTTTADTATFNVSTWFLRQTLSGAIVQGETYTLSVWAKTSASGGAPSVRIALNNSVTWTGSASVKETLTATWRRIEIPWVANGTSAYIVIGAFDAAGATDATGYGNVDLWGAQLNRGPTALAYVPTAAAARYAPAVDWHAASLAWGARSEPAATNRVLWSRDLSNAAWTKTDATATLTAAGVDGAANSASVLTATGANATATQAITSTSRARVLSVWLKRRTGTGTVETTIDGGTTWVARTLTSAWQRFQTTVTSTNPTVGVRIVTSGDAVDVDYVQEEDGAVATSPIPTFAATVTRTIDDVRWPDFMDAEGVVVVEWVPLVAGDSSSPVLFGTSASINHGPFTDGTQALSHWNGSAVLTATGAIAVGARNAAVLSWSASGRAVALNGGAVATDAGAIGTTDLFRIGATGAGNQPYPLLMTRIRTAPRRPPNDRVRTLGIVS